MEISINYLAVLVAAIVSYAVGAWWHSPAGFGKHWQRMMSFTKESMHTMPLTAKQAIILGFFITLLVSYVLAHFVALLIPAAAPAWLMLSLQLGFWVWLGFLAPTVANGWLWEGKSVKLFLFNAGYQLLSIEIMAVILGLWR